jgi:hypothetical protein
MNAADLKRKHEIAVANALLEAVQKKAAFVHLGNDKDEPDVIYKCDDHPLGIEIATAYYDNSDAKQEWTWREASGPCHRKAMKRGLLA